MPEIAPKGPQKRVTQMGLEGMHRGQHKGKNVPQKPQKGGEAKQGQRARPRAVARQDRMYSIRISMLYTLS